MFEEIIKKIDWKPVLLSGWEQLRPKLEEKVKDTESKIDDALLGAFDVLVEKFLK